MFYDARAGSMARTRLSSTAQMNSIRIGEQRSPNTTCGRRRGRSRWGSCGCRERKRACLFSKGVSPTIMPSGSRSSRHVSRSSWRCSTTWLSTWRCRRLQRDLDATTTQLQWIVSAYTLVFASLQITAGGLGDRFGRKRWFMIGLAIFTAVFGIGGVRRTRSSNVDRCCGPCKALARR